MALGNTKGLKQAFLQRLDALREVEIARGEFATVELLQSMAALTQECGREIAVYIARDGEILDVFIGTGEEVLLPQVRLRRSAQGLCGVRCIHTHPQGSSRLSEKDENTLRELQLDAMSAVSVRDGQPGSITIGLLETPETVRFLGPILIQRIEKSMWMQEVLQADAQIRACSRDADTQPARQQALLVGLELPQDDAAEDSLAELERLVDTAGAETVGRMLQKRKAPDGAYYIGSGKLEQLREACRQTRADLIVFNDELTAIQLRNLEDALGMRIVDRTTLILDIFAQRASSREGKLQVELAQQAYRLPRLTGMGVMLSRLGGGIGTRGPGEKKLEVNRRHIRRRIAELERELDAIRKQRAVRRLRRQKNEVPVVALVGYTNAGKSTLLNQLSGSDVLAEDKLFATLDAVSRRVQLPDGTPCLFVDTVGFIEKLPHDLVRAFRATLEEAAHADVLLHVIDASNDAWPRQRDVVLSVLEDIGAADKPIVQAFNQADRLQSGQIELLDADGVVISAKEASGMEELLRAVQARLGMQSVCCRLCIPYDKGALVSRLHDAARQVEVSYAADGVHMTLTLDAQDWARLRAEAAPFCTAEEEA